MMTDAQLLFSDAQAITADAASTNLIDLGAVRQIGQGEPMGIAILVDVAADSTTGDETYEFELQTDDNAAFSSATEVLAQAITAARLTAGSLHVIPLSPSILPLLERYIRLNYDVGGTTPTITVTAWLSPLSALAGRSPIYADGFNISA